MRAKNLQSKTYIAPVMVATGLSIIGVGLSSDGAALADAALVRDTINVTVSPSCTFTGTNNNKDFAGSAVNGAEVNNFNDSGEHVFNIFCNDHNGFVVTATPYDLEDSSVESAKINYTANYSPSGVNGLWTAGIDSDATGVEVVATVPKNGGTILESSSNTSADGVSFTATYSAYVGSATPAGTYAGRIEYTLTASSTSNTSGSEHENTNPEPGINNDDPSNTNEPGSTDHGSNSTDSVNPVDTNSIPSNSQSSSNTNASTNDSTPSSLASTTDNSSYSTYNTYNTNNYSSSSSTPTTGSNAVSPLLANTNSDATNSDEGSSSDSDNNYEKPLGVTSTAKSLSKDSSEIDPMPIVATGVLATIGIAAIALIKSSDKEEK